MQTPSIGRARPSEPARRRSASGASAGTADFAQQVGLMSRPEVERATELAKAASLTAILGEQEIDSDAGSPRAAAGRYGSDLLDGLTELRMDVLEGRVSASRLASLAHALRKDRPCCGDVRVDDILDAIELRVEVEIAKLTCAASAGRHGPAASPNS